MDTMGNYERIQRMREKRRKYGAPQAQEESKFFKRTFMQLCICSGLALLCFLSHVWGIALPFEEETRNLLVKNDDFVWYYNVSMGFIRDSSTRLLTQIKTIAGLDQEEAPAPVQGGAEVQGEIPSEQAPEERPSEFIPEETPQSDGE